jgi:hypothetical protein
LKKATGMRKALWRQYSDGMENCQEKAVKFPLMRSAQAVDANLLEVYFQELRECRGAHL